jgi:hypothetical protein
MQYQIYDIKLVEDGRGEWKGRIRRQDRRLIKWESNDTPGPVVITNACPTKEMALAEAKRAINGGGMTAAE